MKDEKGEREKGSKEAREKAGRVDIPVRLSK